MARLDGMIDLYVGMMFSCCWYRFVCEDNFCLFHVICLYFGIDMFVVAVVFASEPAFLPHDAASLGFDSNRRPPESEPILLPTGLSVQPLVAASVCVFESEKFVLVRMDSLFSRAR